MSSPTQDQEININISEIKNTNPIPKKNLERWQKLQFLMKEEVTLNEKSN